MCGFVGYASSGPPGDPSLLAAQRDLLWHRGPDDRGTWWSPDGRVGLAHCRLAVIDLTAAGRQPMSDEKRGTRIIYNGEIYNHGDVRDQLRRAGHEFRTRTDTEVILRAYAQWGEACVDRFIGMFAFALYDERARHIVLARDRAGEKPLFYHQSGGVLRFASEVKALFADPAVARVVDPEALDWYLAFGFVPGQLSMIAGVRRVEPGNRVRFDVDSGTLHCEAYWRLPPSGPRPPMERQEAGQEVERLLRESVAGQLVADVPIGILLSGGLDSSLVTAMAARVSPRRVKTFTVTFPGSGSYDEGPFARAVARHCETEHHELAAEPASVDLLVELARQFDDPIADSSMVATLLVARLVHAHATVALSGDGGDELFGGYPHYSWLQQLERVRRLAPRSLRMAVATAASSLPPGTRGRNHLIGMGGNVRASIGHINLFFDRRMRQRLVPSLYDSREGRSLDAEARKGAYEPSATPLQAASATDFRTYLVDDILVKVDRASMLTSLEVRAPFLDHRIVEFAFGRLPDGLRATAKERKVVLKSLAQRLLPAGFDVSRKQGFTLPLDQWFGGRWGRFFRETLTGEALPGFDRHSIDRLFEAQQRGYRNTQRLFALCMLELWRKNYGMVFP
ncbi:MAG: asparagine synthase (glutamine-hydrolyzing) [Longimicrobiales bacterium]